MSSLSILADKEINHFSSYIRCINAYIICPTISFENRINNKNFPGQMSSVTFTKNVLYVVTQALPLNLELGALGLVSFFSVKTEFFINRIVISIIVFIY